MPRSKKKWALIWWIETHDSNVIELNKIKKADQSEGCVTTLKWQDDKNNTSFHSGKVIRISENRDELEKLFLAADGAIKDSSTKLFSSATISDQQERSHQEKLVQTIRKSNQRKIATKILNDLPIFTTDDAPLIKKPRKDDTEGKNSDENRGRYPQPGRNNFNVHKVDSCRSAPVASTTMTSSHQYSASQSQILMPSQSPHVLKERFFQRSASSLDAHHKYTSCGKKRHVKSKSSKYHPDKCPPQKSQIHPATMTTASNCGNQDSYRYVRNGQDERPCKNWPSQSANMIGVQGQGDSRSCNSQNQGNPLSSRTAPPWQEHSRSTSPFPSFSHPMDAYPTSYPWSQSSISSEPYPFQSMGYYGHHYPPPQQADPDNMNYCNCRPLPSEFPMIETGDNTQDKVFTDLQKVRNPLYRIDEFVQNRNSKTTSSFKTQQSSAIEQRSLGVETHSLNQETDVIVESPKHMGFLGSIIDKNSENCQDQAKGENKNEERHETRDLPNISTSATSVQSQSIEKAESSSSQDDSDMPDDYSDGEGVHSSDEKSLESNLCMETSDNKNIDKAAQRLAKLLPNPIPRGWVMCQKILLKALTYNCEKTNGAKGNEMFTPPPLPEEFYKSGEDKVEIAERCGFYLKKNLVTYVEMMTKDGNGFYWRSAVTIVLNEVYKGSYSLTDYCALGARGGGRPGICKRLFAGLYSKIKLSSHYYD